MTRRFILVAVVSGILFGLMDGLLNGNPLAARLYAAFQPIARSSINMPAAVSIDLIYGFLMAAIFVLLYGSLPGKAGLLKGVSFGVLAWFFRVLMVAASQWVMFEVPLVSLLYTAGAGLIEMVLLGMLYGLTLRP